MTTAKTRPAILHQWYNTYRLGPLSGIAVTGNKPFIRLADAAVDVLRYAPSTGKRILLGQYTTLGDMRCRMPLAFTFNCRRRRISVTGLTCVVISVAAAANCRVRLVDLADDGPVMDQQFSAFYASVLRLMTTSDVIDLTMGSIYQELSR